MDYRTPRGYLYSFSGWLEGESPVELFEARDWIRCLHGCMLCYAILNEQDQTQLAISDDGLLHELLHLAVGTEICHHSTMQELEEDVADLQQRFDRRIECGI